METGDRIVRGRIFLRYHEWLLLAADCLAGVRILFRVLGEVSGAEFNRWKQTAAFLFLKAYRACQACFVLFNEGYPHESYIPLRTAFEYLIEMKYLQKFPAELSTRPVRVFRS